MKNLSFIILAFSFFTVLPSYSNPIYEQNNFIKMPGRFKRIDTNGDGLLSKDEMISAHRDRIDKIFINFDKDGDSMLSKKELRALRYELRKRINKLSKKELRALRNELKKMINKFKEEGV
tara:strand:+ start:377 stop:736 length:360 start_codon:yes stop_codon:yes gene_type:complete